MASIVQALDSLPVGSTAAAAAALLRKKCWRKADLDTARSTLADRHFPSSEIRRRKGEKMSDIAKDVLELFLFSRNAGPRPNFCIPSETAEASAPPRKQRRLRASSVTAQASSTRILSNKQERPQASQGKLCATMLHQMYIVPRGAQHDHWLLNDNDNVWLDTLSLEKC